MNRGEKRNLRSGMWKNRLDENVLCKPLTTPLKTAKILPEQGS